MEKEVDTDAASASNKSEEDSSKKTLGEELFLVHLNRFGKEERSPNDFDVDTKQHQPEQSVGEELWRVHCKRMEGTEEQPEEEEEEKEEETTKIHAIKAHQTTPKRKMPARFIKLRNRRVRMTMT